VKQVLCDSAGLGPTPPQTPEESTGSSDECSTDPEPLSPESTSSSPAKEQNTTTAPVHSRGLQKPVLATREKRKRTVEDSKPETDSSLSKIRRLSHDSGVVLVTMRRMNK
jgi:hypothetical protein